MTEECPLCGVVIEEGEGHNRAALRLCRPCAEGPRRCHACDQVTTIGMVGADFEWCFTCWRLDLMRMVGSGPSPPDYVRPVGTAGRYVPEWAEPLAPALGKQEKR